MVFHPCTFSLRGGVTMHRSLRTALIALALVASGAVPVAAAHAAAPAAVPVTAASSADPGPKDVIVHLFEWPWASVASECVNVLGPKGFGGVQVSPPQEHVVLPGQGYPWWQDYQPVSYRIESRRGDRAAFANMVSACHGAAPPPLPRRRRQGVRRRGRQPHGGRRVDRFRQRRLDLRPLRVPVGPV